MSNLHFDLVVIGAGPGGEVAAIRAAQLGLKTALVEKRKHLGGTCLNVGCIPTKSLLESAKTLKRIVKAKTQGFQFESFEYNWDQILQRKEKIVDGQRKGLRFLMKKNKVTCFEGLGSFVSPHELKVSHKDQQETLIKADHFLIATGSEVNIPPIAKVDGDLIHSSDTIMDIDKVPDSLVIVGGGVVGLEFACLFNTFGSKVTVVELAENVLAHEDDETVAELVKCLKKQGISIKTGTKVEAITPGSDQVAVKTNDGQKKAIVRFFFL